MSFEEIYHDYYQRIFRVCMGYVNDHDWAQDLTQETLIAVWQKLSQFRNEAAVGTWIFRIASNNCLRQIERTKRMPRTEMPFQLEDRQEPALEGQVGLLYKYISGLPELDRIIISLELEDVKQAEIATIVGLTESHLRVRIHRIKDKLYKKFKSDGPQF
jgi:RNA polymerase sigma-70 factor (ECF subfamily)